MNFGKSVRESVALCVTTLEEITAAEKELAAARKAGKIAPADAEAKSAELACARADALGTVNTRIERDRLAHHAAVDEWNTADGSKIDTGDLKLLQAISTLIRRSSKRFVTSTATMRPCCSSLRSTARSTATGT